MIDGATRLVGLIGWPVEHSLSPKIHNAAFDALGLNWRYVPLPVSPGEEGACVRGLAALGFVGANVTVPHKTTVMEHLDAFDRDADAVGAVNTLVVHQKADGSAAVRGHNTDHVGFLAPLRRAGFDAAGRSIVVVGAGGAARAAVFALSKAGAAEIVVLNRDLDRARRLASDLSGTGPGSIRPARFAPDALVDAARTASLLVHATPVGMASNAERSIWPDDVRVPRNLFVYDLVYAPRETRLLRQARSCGAATLGGLDMLVEQGAVAFSLWTGCAAPTDVMRVACEAATGGGSACDS